MRVLAVVCLVGCVGRGGGSPDDQGPGPIFTPGGDPSGRCHDGGCGAGLVCARNGACLPPDQVRAIHVSWTVSGNPASETSCAGAPDLRIDLNSTTNAAVHMSFAPVPCVEGKFSVDKSPIAIDHVALGREFGDGGREAKIDATTGEALLDLPY